MKFLESKPKSLIYTILIIILIMFEMSVLSGYRFVEVGTAADKYATGMSMEKVTSLALVGANVGWNYITCSLLIILGTWGFSMLLGYNRNYGGLLAIIIMNVVPMLGFVTNFNFFVGYGYGIYSPAMALFGMTYNLTSKAQQITNNLIFAIIVIVLSVVCWFIGYRIRAAYAAKYEFDD
jgi:hypothetical protein